MPRANIYFSTEEDDIINLYSKKWKMNKEETIKRIVKEFKEENNGDIR